MCALFFAQAFERPGLVFDLAGVPLEGFFDMEELEQEAAEYEVVLSTHRGIKSQKVQQV